MLAVTNPTPTTSTSTNPIPIQGSGSSTTAHSPEKPASGKSSALPPSILQSKLEALKNGNNPSLPSAGPQVTEMLGAPKSFEPFNEAAKTSSPEEPSIFNLSNTTDEGLNEELYGTVLPDFPIPVFEDSALKLPKGDIPDPFAALQNLGKLEPPSPAFEPTPTSGTIDTNSPFASVSPLQEPEVPNFSETPQSLSTNQFEEVQQEIQPSLQSTEQVTPTLKAETKPFEQGLDKPQVLEAEVEPKSTVEKRGSDQADVKAVAETLQPETIQKEESPSKPGGFASVMRNWNKYPDLEKSLSIETKSTSVSNPFSKKPSKLYSGEALNMLVARRAA